MFNTCPRIILVLVLSILCISCSSGGGSNDDPGSGNSSLVLNRQSLSAVADGSGLAQFAFALPSGSSSFQLSASTGALRALSGTAGDLLQQGSAVSSTQLGLVTNVPYYSASGISGQNFNASYSADPGTTVNLQVFSKVDSTPSSGNLKLNIVLLGPVGNAEDIGEALDEALEAVRITYSRAGIVLDTQISNFEGPGIAPPIGDPLYQSIVSAQRAASITVVLAADRRGGSKTNEFKFGTIGSTPFSVQASANSVILIAITDVAGPAAVFDNTVHNDEKRLLGEEIGRYTAKALGVPNIVTLRGNKTISSDDIPDSPSCISETGCREDARSRTNLMFPEPLLELKEDVDQQRREYYPRDQLSAQQIQVLNNSVFVD